MTLMVKSGSIIPTYLYMSDICFLPMMTLTLVLDIALILLGCNFSTFYNIKSIVHINLSVYLLLYKKG